jgi:putative aldouronate transport system substrate-binding protein
MLDGSGRGLTRRTLLRAGGTLGLIGTLGAAALLEACSRPAPSPGATAAAGAPAAGSTTGFAYPSHISFAGPKPDLAGGPNGLPDAFFSYPSSTVKSVQSPPGKGGDVTVLSTSVGGGPPPPVEQNPTWQQVNKDLNVSLKFILSGNSTDQAEKLSTLIAGGDLPDMIYLGSAPPINNLPQFLEASCADLTPYLAGDAAKDYPNLANIPDFSWKANCVYDKKIFGVPATRAITGNTLHVRQELLDKAGIGPITSADDFRRALVALTDANAGAYGTASLQFENPSILAGQIFGAPNNWRVGSDGKLVKDYETEEFKAGLGYLRDLWSAGVFHPNTMTYVNVAAGADFRAGKFAFYYTLEDSFQNYWRDVSSDPNAKTRMVPPFSADGKAKPQYYVGIGNLGATVLRKAPADRIKELLGVFNYMSAPFGSTEKLLATYGTRNVDYTLDAQGNPVATTSGAASYNAHPLPFTFIAQGPTVIYSPINSKDFATIQYAQDQAELAVGVTDPTNSLYSASNGKLGPSLRRAVVDGINAIVTSRQPLTDWTTIVGTWQSNGGNTIRDEYQAALAAQKS